MVPNEGPIINCLGGELQVTVVLLVRHNVMSQSNISMGASQKLVERESNVSMGASQILVWTRVKCYPLVVVSCQRDTSTATQQATS